MVNFVKLKSSRKILSVFILLFISCQIYAQPQANFTTSERTGCGSLQVNFTNASSGNIVSYNWDLGGVNSVNENPGRIFGTPGKYDICLTVTDSEGATDTKCRTDYIVVFHLPEPNFEVDNTNGCVPFEVNFTDASTSIDGEIQEWIWGVGGSTGVVTNEGSPNQVSSTYNLVDSYSVNLTVKDDNGCRNTITKENILTVNPDPIINFSSPDTLGCEAPHVVNLINQSPGQDLTYQWNFGNGGASQLENPDAVVYQRSGFYPVALRITDNATGCTSFMRKDSFIRVGVEADFTISQDTVCKGGEITFRDLSEDAASSVLWDFGDGNTSSDANPIHIYDTVGCFNVSLTRVVNGCTTTVQSSQCIASLEVDEPSIFIDKPHGCTVPHLVNFATNQIEGISYEWNFGDGSTSSEQSPSHIYTTEGTFIVTLKAFNAYDCFQTVIDSVEVQPILAIIGEEEQKGCTPLSVNMKDGSRAYHNIVSKEWEVLNNAFAPPITYTFTDSISNLVLADTGKYDVRLIVQDAKGCIDTVMRDDLIAVGMETEVEFTASPREACVNTAVSFSEQSSDYANKWVWEFGDGDILEGRGAIHDYIDTGYMDVTLTVLHHECPTPLTKNEFVNILSPKAGFEVVRNCDDLYLISFTDKSIDADSLYYDFGTSETGEDTSTLRNPAWLFPGVGDYFVEQVTYNFTTGCTDTIRQLVQITKPIADFTLSATEGCVPFTVTVTNNSNDATANLWNTTYGNSLDGSVEREPELSFDVAGKYSGIELIVTDVNGCKDKFLFTDTITAHDIIVGFEVDEPIGCYPHTVEFTDLSTSMFGNIENWDWSYGDATTDTVENPQHTYNSAGFFDVSLLVKDNNGCEKSLLIEDMIEVTRPIADFSTIDTLSCSTYGVQFENASEGNELTYEWDFGDTRTSTASNPKHLYENEGLYSICLTVTDKHGCQDTKCKIDYVLIADPVAEFTVDTTFGTCPPLVVNFENLSLNASRCKWDFGDDSGSSNQADPPHVYTASGHYDVQLIAMTTDNCRDTLLKEEYIHLSGPIGSFTFDKDTICAPDVITFIGESDHPYQFVWDFGDGSLSLDTSENVMADTIRFEYTIAGDFVPQLKLIDEEHCATTLKGDTILVSSMEVDFIANDTLFCDRDAQATFVNITVTSHPLLDIQWLLEGADIVLTNAPEPTVNYATQGNYAASLYATNGFCTETLKKEDYIGVGETPKVGFIVSDSVGCGPFTVSCQDTSNAQNTAVTEWQWFLDDGLNAEIENPVFIFNELGVHDIKLIATTEVGCFDSLTREVTVIGSPSFEILKPEPICIGDEVQLEPIFEEDTTGYVYYWMSSPDLDCTECLNPNANPASTTTYNFVTRNEHGCATVEQVEVEVRPFPLPDIRTSNDTTICNGDFVQLLVSGGDELQDYEWDASQPGLSCYDACINPIARPDTTTVYRVSITNIHNCHAEDSIRVSISNEWEPIAGEDQTICLGDDIQLNVSGNNPEWLVTDRLSCTYCPDPIASPIETTTYEVKSLSNIGCLILDSVTINIVEPEAIEAGEDITVCKGETVTLTGTGEGAVKWSPANLVDNSNALETSTTPLENTTMYFFSVEQGACILEDSVEVKVVDKTEVEVEDVIICEGEILDLSYTGAADVVQWYNSEGIPVNADVMPTSNEEYYIIAKHGICVEDTARMMVNVLSAPQVILGDSLVFLPGQAITIDLGIPDSVHYAYQWTPANLLSCDTCSSPTLIPDSSMVLSVNVLDEETGCSTEDQVSLKMLGTCPGSLIGVPNAFSPNGDGSNDFLRIYPNPSVKSIERFTIYNRWGAIMYETEDMNALGWDGKHEGVICDNGVYVYVVEFECELSGDIVVSAGDITLIR